MYKKNCPICFSNLDDLLTRCPRCGWDFPKANGDVVESARWLLERMNQARRLWLTRASRGFEDDEARRERATFLKLEVGGPSPSQAPVAPKVAPELKLVKSDSVFQITSCGIEFVPISAGTFIMGTDYLFPSGRTFEGPPHCVNITRPFGMGRYPVTQQQWVEIMGYNPSFFKDLTRPVESVSWDESCQFIRCLNYQEGTNRYRLPTEAEWEYVARCGGLVDPKKKKEPLGQIAWYKGNSKSESKPVGTRLPNPWGLYDMQGNVWEWVFDWFDDYPLEPCNDPLGPNEGTARVIRGGAWGTSDFLCHIHIRSVKAPRERSPLIGLRLVIEDSLPADGRFAIFNAGG